MIGADNITRRSEGPLAGCATATAKIFGSRSLAGRWGRSPTQVALGNAAGRLPGGKPDEGEPHVRFGKGEQETGFATAPAPHFTCLDYTSLWIRGRLHSKVNRLINHNA